MAYAVQARTHNQTYPKRPPGADLHPKKVCNLDPMALTPAAQSRPTISAFEGRLELQATSRSEIVFPA